MGNPITTMFKALMETEDSRIGRMAERVAEGSIDAQIQVDEYSRPNTYGHTYYLVEEGRPRAFNSFTCNNSYFKGRAGGAGSSFKTCRYYTDQARDRRDALMEKVEAEKA